MLFTCNACLEKWTIPAMWSAKYKNSKAAPTVYKDFSPSVLELKRDTHTHVRHLRLVYNFNKASQEYNIKKRKRKQNQLQFLMTH